MLPISMPPIARIAVLLCAIFAVAAANDAPVIGILTQPYSGPNASKSVRFSRAKFTSFLLTISFRSRPTSQPPTSSTSRAPAAALSPSTSRNPSKISVGRALAAAVLARLFHDTIARSNPVFQTEWCFVSWWWRGSERRLSIYCRSIARFQHQRQRRRHRRNIPDLGNMPRELARTPEEPSALHSFIRRASRPCAPSPLATSACCRTPTPRT